MPFKPAPRLQAFDYVGLHQYFLTICTSSRARLFVDNAAVQVALLALSRTAETESFKVIAYCLMPDHFHALVEGADPTSDFFAFVRVFKQRSSFDWKQRTGAMLWQRSYFEHVLRSDEHVVGVARYILENPVRAGLVLRPEDYPHLGSMTMTVHDLLYSIQI